MSLLRVTSRAPSSPRRPARAALVALAWVAASLGLGGCGLISSGACVTGSNLYFCQEDSREQCQEFWCDDWAYCGYFEATSCDELGFSSDSRDTFSPPQTPDWEQGTPSGGDSSGGGTGSGSTSEGACAYYDTVLSRAVCDPYSSATKCTGKYFGTGTTCTGISCTNGADPYSCTIPGGSGGGSGGGTGSGGSCDSAWTCQYDAQSATMCSWACAHTGTERTQTCQVLASMVDSGNAGECCTACR